MREIKSRKFQSKILLENRSYGPYYTLNVSAMIDASFQRKEIFKKLSFS